MSRPLQALLLAGFFAAVFVGLRNLPASECGFLHYTEVYNPVTGETELCSFEPAEFVDLVRSPFPVEKEYLRDVAEAFQSDHRIVFRYRDPNGAVILPHEIGITHTERIHLLLIHEDRDQYYHLHPDVSRDGESFGVVLPELAPGEWTLFSEFVPHRTRRIVMIRDSFVVGESRSTSPTASPVAVARLEVEGAADVLRAGRDYRLRVCIPAGGSSGEAPRLEMVMDAYAHLVAFDRELHGYVHMHPLEEKLDAPGGPELEFLFHPPKPGNYRVWLQLQIKGEPVFQPFDLEVT